MWLDSLTSRDAIAVDKSPSHRHRIYRCYAGLCIFRSMWVRRRVDCFPDGHPGYGDWLAEYPLGYGLTHGPDDRAVLHRADCPHRLRAKDLHGLANVKNDAPPSGQRSKSGRPSAPTSPIFGSAALVSKPDVSKQGCKYRRISAYS